MLELGSSSHSSGGMSPLFDPPISYQNTTKPKLVASVLASGGDGGIVPESRTFISPFGAHKRSRVLGRRLVFFSLRGSRKIYCGASIPPRKVRRHLAHLYRTKTAALADGHVFVFGGHPVGDLEPARELRVAII